MYSQSEEKTTYIAITALHRQMVSRVHQLEELAARCDGLGQYDKAARYVTLCNQVIDAFAELKRRMIWRGDTP